MALVHDGEYQEMFVDGYLIPLKNRNGFKYLTAGYELRKCYPHVPLMDHEIISSKYNNAW